MTPELASTAICTASRGDCCQRLDRDRWNRRFFFLGQRRNRRRQPACELTRVEWRAGWIAAGSSGCDAGAAAARSIVERTLSRSPGGPDKVRPTEPRPTITATTSNAAAPASAGTNDQTGRRRCRCDRARCCAALMTAPLRPAGERLRLSARRSDRGLFISHRHTPGPPASPAPSCAPRTPATSPCRAECRACARSPRTDTPRSAPAAARRAASASAPESR